MTKNKNTVVKQLAQRLFIASMASFVAAIYVVSRYLRVLSFVCVIRDGGGFVRRGSRSACYRCCALFFGLSILASSAVWADELNVRFKPVFPSDSLHQTEGISAITCVAQDAEGYMWFGGENGLARYNGETMEVFHNVAGDSNSLSGNYVWDIAVDHNGELWIATAEGLNRFDAATHGFVRYNKAEPGPLVESESRLREDVIFELAVGGDNTLWLGTPTGLYQFSADRDQFASVAYFESQHVRSLYVDDNNSLWVGVFDRGLTRYDPKTKNYLAWVHSSADPNSIPHNNVSAIAQDASGKIWVGTLGGGFAVLESDELKFTRFKNDPTETNSLPSNAIWDLQFAKDGLLWIATDPGGLAVFDVETEGFQVFNHSPYSVSSISSNKVRTVFNDAAGDLWVGLFPGGVDFYDRTSSAFYNFVAEPGNAQSLSDSAVVTFFEDSDNTLWVGTESGLNAFDRETKTFTQYLPERGNSTQLQAGAVLAINEDPSGDLWVGTWSGGAYRFNKQTQVFKRYGADPNDPHSLGDNYVWSIVRDSQQRIWLGTESTGLHLYRPETDDFRIFEPNPNVADSLSYHHIWSLLEDSNQQLWVGTMNGLDRLESLTETSSSFVHYPHDPNSTNTIIGHGMIALYEDAKGYIWVGTSGSGLNRIEPSTGDVRRFGLADGLPSLYVSSIIQDDNNQLWVTTVKGLASIDLSSFKVKTYTVADGLVGNTFNRNATFKDSWGNLYFGSSKGMSIFNPKHSHTKAAPPPVVLDEFRLFNRVVRAGDAANVLQKSINQTEHLKLSYKHVMFAFDFYALSYGAPHRNEYSYKLEGFDQSWNDVGNKHTATYTNIDPGDYVFRVRAANSDGVWNDEGATIKITIKAPPWATVWAYIIYVLIGFLVIATIVQNQRKRMALQHQTELNANLIKVDRLKDAFLANTSHELRTPLNGIIGLAEAMLDGAMGELNDAMKHSLKMIAFSGRRLSSLVNDILDHSKLNENTLDVSLKPVNLHLICNVVMDLSNPLIGKKPVRLENCIPSEATVLGDENRLQQILHNIIGNAIKFTKRGEVIVRAVERKGMWHIVVKDTGIGIKPADLKRVFQAFTQVNNTDSRDHGGTGLGLAITRQLVALHGGRIDVRSEFGVGSEFELVLPATEPTIAELTPIPEETEDDIRTAAALMSGSSTVLNVMAQNTRDEGDTILVVDDDSVNRMVIKSMLNLHGYRVIEASGGPQALEIIHSGTKVALVILDVMMPEMSGFEVCMRIRAEHPIDRLPILFLTAKNVQDDLIKGFVSGGNSYLLKPVEKHQLLTRVLRHIAAAKTNEKLVEQIERSESKNRNSLLGLDAMEGILRVMNSSRSASEVLSVVARYVLNITKGHAAFYWAYNPAVGLFELTYQYNGDGRAVDFISGKCDIKVTKEEGGGCDDNIFTQFVDANSHGDFTPMLVSYAKLAKSFVLPIRYNGQANGIFVFTLGDLLDQNFQVDEALGRIRTHVIAAVVKSMSDEQL